MEFSQKSFNPSGWGGKKRSGVDKETFVGVLPTQFFPARRTPLLLSQKSGVWGGGRGGNTREKGCSREIYLEKVCGTCENREEVQK